MQLTEKQFQIIKGRQSAVQQVEAALVQARQGMAEALMMLEEQYGVGLLDGSHFIDEDGKIQEAQEETTDEDPPTKQTKRSRK